MKPAYLVCLFILLRTTLALAQNPVPFVNQPLVPSGAAPGGLGFTLTVNGTGFVSGATVNWNGAGLATTFVSSSQLTATVPASDIATATTASVTVVNPGPGGGASDVQFFSVAVATSSVVLTESDSSTGLVPDTNTGIVARDFNGDGRLDLVTPGASTPGMCVLLGKGDGSFQPPKCSGGASFNEVIMVTGDFNRDGRLDMAVANTSVGPAEVLLGNGDGTFQTATVVGPNILAAYSGLAAADVNRDGKLDIVTAQFDPTGPLATFTVFPGNGDGTSSQPVVTTFGQANAEPIVIGDFNGDGKLDLIEPGFLFLGNGDGTFQPPQAFTMPNAAEVIAADIDGDGKLDLVGIVTPASAESVSVALGNGDGTFQNATTWPAGNHPISIASVDLNGDGKLDLAVLDGLSNPPTLSVLLGNGDGSFQNPVVQSLNAGGQSSQGLQAGDFNSNGQMDLAVRGAVGQAHDLALLLQGPAFMIGLGIPPGGSNSATVPGGATANYTLSIGGSGLSGTASLTCAGAPAGATCSVPSSENVNATTASTFNVTVSTTGASAALHGKSPLFTWLWATALIGIVVLPVARSSQRGRKPWTMLALMLIMFLTSCGGNGGGSGSGGTPTGTYTLTVTASMGSATQSLKLTLIVAQ